MSASDLGGEHDFAAAAGAASRSSAWEAACSQHGLAGKRSVRHHGPATNQV